MSYSLNFLPEAEKDILNSIQWYNSEKEGLGFDFYTQFQQTVLRVIHNPLHYSIRIKHLRASKVYRYPFLMYYKILENQKSITVIAVLHTSRNPKEISKRK